MLHPSELRDVRERRQSTGQWPDRVGALPAGWGAAHDAPREIRPPRTMHRAGRATTHDAPREMRHRARCTARDAPPRTMHRARYATAHDAPRGTRHRARCTARDTPPRTMHPRAGCATARRAPPRPTVLPHVQRELAAAARELGAHVLAELLLGGAVAHDAHAAVGA